MSKVKLAFAVAFMPVIHINTLAGTAVSAAQNPAGPTLNSPILEQPILPPVSLPSPELREFPTGADIDKRSSDALRASPIKLGALLQVASMQPLALDAKFNRPIELREALDYALDKSLPIRISKESTLYQATQLVSYMSYFLPSFSTTYALAHLNINNSETTTNSDVFATRLLFPLFAGGSYTYFTMAQWLRVKGWREAQQANTNDALLDVYVKYTTLVLNHQLLRIRIQSVETSQANLDQAVILYKGGSGTQFAIMQSRAQLALDKQALLTQQVTTRQSAIALAYALNLPLSVNLVPTDLDVAEHPLFKGKATIGRLINIAFARRPELKEYEHFRLAAARDVQIGAAPLYPTVSGFVAYTHSNLTFAGSSAGLSGASTTAISLGGFNTATASNVALGQVANVSAESSQTASSGANTGAASTVASSGGTPIASTQSGSLVTSGAVAPGIISPVAISGTLGGSNINGSNTASFGSSPGNINSFQAGLNINWSLPNGLGGNSYANIVALRALSRQALLQMNQEAQLITEQVRSSYLNALTALTQIESTGSQLDTDREAMRLAQLRLSTGKGTNLELLQAKTNYVKSLTTEAQSMIAVQQAQAQLIHDLGVISISTLTEGYRPDLQSTRSN